MHQRIWMVGGSSGIGLELVKLWLESGSSVVVSARSATLSPELLKLKHQFSEYLYLIDMDVSKEDSVKESSAVAWKQFDGFDLWFYNAGAYETMDLANFDVEKLEQMMQVNYLGALRVMSHLLPKIDKIIATRFVFNLSLSSYIGLPYGGGYSAPKAALLNLAEALQPELLQQNIFLQVINHGFVKTQLTAKNDFKMPQLMSPEDAAFEIYKRLEAPYHFEIRFPYGLTLFLRFLRFLPYRFSLWMTKKALR